MNYKTYKVNVYENGDKYWYNEQRQLHNADGPAIECANGYKSYYLNDEKYSHEAWKKEVEKSKVKELTVSEVSKLLGFEVKIVKC